MTISLFYCRALHENSDSTNSINVVTFSVAEWSKQGLALVGFRSIALNEVICFYCIRYVKLKEVCPCYSGVVGTKCD